MRECLALPAEKSLPRCLVIDPDHNFAKVLAGIVAQHGFDTKIIAEPFEALRELRAAAYDLVLLDFAAPDAAFMLDVVRRDIPTVLDKTVIVTTNPLLSSNVTAGVPIIGKNDLQPLMRYLTL